MSSLKLDGRGKEKILSHDDQQAKVKEVRKTVGPVLDKFPTLTSDASILRFLRARNWNTDRAAKMLKEAIKWRSKYKPEKLRWEDVAQEAETGKVYIANFCDKYGRTVLVMRPGFHQNTSTTEGQIRYLVYCMENAILDLKLGQEQMVWLIDFQRWNMSSISVKVTKETAHVLQDCYPERLGLGILYNPPKVFESFWLMVKPFLEKKTYRKVKFVYSDKPESRKVMETLFDMDKLESCFGGKSAAGFSYEAYATRMKEVDKRMDEFVKSGSQLPSDQAPELKDPGTVTISETASEASDDQEDQSTLEGGGGDDYNEEIEICKDTAEPAKHDDNNNNARDI